MPCSALGRCTVGCRERQEFGGTHIWRLIEMLANCNTSMGYHTFYSYESLVFGGECTQVSGYTPFITQLSQLYFSYTSVITQLSQLCLSYNTIIRDITVVPQL